MLNPESMNNVNSIIKLRAPACAEHIYYTSVISHK